MNWIGNRCLTIKTKKEMKKNLFMVAAVALIAMVSCNKEEINNPALPQEGEACDIVFVAEFDQDTQTKTALGDVVDGKRQATWVAGDAISINGTTFTAKADGATAEFATAETFDETAEVFRAVYPAESYKSSAVAIPASQNGTFANASIAVAESDNQSLKFSNVSSILKFQVPVKCDVVTFESNNSLAGNVSIAYNEGVMTPDYASLSQFSKKITVKAVGGFVPETDYYVAVKPGDHQFTVSIDGKVSKASTKEATVGRSKILDMKVLPEPKPAVINLVPNVDWCSSSAKFAAYFFGSGETWVELTLSDKPGVYSCQVPDGEYTNVILCRMNPSKSINDGWDAKWDQTNDLDIPKDNKNYYYIQGWSNSDISKWDTEDYCSTYFPTEGNLYLLPQNKWVQHNERYAAYFFEDGKTEKWENLNPVSGCKYLSSSYYEVTPPSGYTNVIFCRMNGSNSTNGWGSKWDQSADLKVSGGHLYTISEKGGSWSNFEF